MKKNNSVRGVVFPLLAAMIWGTAFVAQDVCADVIDTFTFNAIRSYVAVIVLLIIIFVFDKVDKNKVERTPEQKAIDRKNLIKGGLWCGIALASPPISNRPVSRPVPTPARPDLSPPSMWYWCLCSVCSSSGR